MSSKWKERNAKSGKDGKYEENLCQSEEGALAWDRQLCWGQWQPHEIQRGRRGSKRKSEVPQGTWFGGARKGSLWLCYVGPFAGRQKSRISGNRHRPKPIPWERRKSQ